MNYCPYSNNTLLCSEMAPDLVVQLLQGGSFVVPPKAAAAVQGKGRDPDPDSFANQSVGRMRRGKIAKAPGEREKDEEGRVSVLLAVVRLTG